MQRRTWSRVREWALLAACILLSGVASAGDWPQILGPGRDAVSVDEPAIPVWKSTGPEQAWSVPIGLGFAGPAVVDQQVICFHRAERQERIESFDRATGRSLWKTDFTATYPGGVNPDNGPRCVPLIHDGHVYVFGAAGELHCVRLADGKKVWSRDAYVDYKGQEGYFGAGSTPIVAGQKLLVNVGGADAGIVAFHLKTGETAWKAVDERASYSSPTRATIDGTEYVVFVTRLKCVAVDPADGRVLFAIPFGKTGPTVNAATPLVIGERLFLSASYGVGAKLLQLSSRPRVLWEGDESMSSQYTTSVHREGNLYGIHGREDFGNGELRCIELATGKVRWSQPSFGVGHLILVKDQLVILTIDGQLVLAEARPDRFAELARATVSQDVTRSLPALSDGHLFFRDNADRGGRLVSVKLRGS